MLAELPSSAKVATQVRPGARELGFDEIGAPTEAREVVVVKLNNRDSSKVCCTTCEPSYL
jgi:hypothetical protein